MRQPTPQHAVSMPGFAECCPDLLKVLRCQVYATLDARNHALPTAYTPIVTSFEEKNYRILGTLNHAEFLQPPDVSFVIACTTSLGKTTAPRGRTYDPKKAILKQPTSPSLKNTHYLVSLPTLLWKVRGYSGLYATLCGPWTLAGEADVRRRLDVPAQAVLAFRVQVIIF